METNGQDILEDKYGHAYKGKWAGQAYACFFAYSYFCLGSPFSSVSLNPKIVSLHPMGPFFSLGFSSFPTKKKAVSLVTDSPKSHKSV